MAKVILGLGSSHGPPTEVPPEKWDVFREKDENDPRYDFQALLNAAPADVADRITPEKWRSYYASAQAGIEALSAKLADAKPDVIVIVGNDQREMFQPENTPMFAIYSGESFKSVPRGDLKTLPRYAVEYTKNQDFDRKYRVDQRFARHITGAMVGDGIDLAVCASMPEDRGMGHGTMFVFERLLSREADIPVVPLLINTFYPPNQAPIRRCYEFGQSLRRAIDSYGKDLRVAVICSGGLSHFLLETELDSALLEAMRTKDVEGLLGLPEEKMEIGTSELRNWIATAGALEREKMTIVDYFEAPRTLANTGLAFAFTYWE